MEETNSSQIIRVGTRKSKVILKLFYYFQKNNKVQTCLSCYTRV